MEQLVFFAIKPLLNSSSPSTLFLQQEKNELYVSPHVRLCGLTGMAHIETEDFAQQYSEAILPIFQARYGASTRLEIATWATQINKKVLLRILKDTEILKKRLATNNFSPNKKL